MRYKLRQQNKRIFQRTVVGLLVDLRFLLSIKKKTCKDSHHCDVNSISYDLPLRGNTSDTNMRAQSPLVN